MQADGRQAGTPPGAVLSGHGMLVRYGATTALNCVDLELRAGEIHAVVGENGAGKSTLLRALAGVRRLTGGVIDAPDWLTMAWVPQEPDLPPDLTATEWVFLGCELRNSFGWLQRHAMNAAAGAALRALGCRAGPSAVVGLLSPAQRKQVQLARALRTPVDVLLLDEPTAVLGDEETRALFSALRRVQQNGTAVLYVSHRLDEVVAIADRVTVLRDGRRVSTDPAGSVDPHMLVHRMVGRALPPRARVSHVVAEPAVRLTAVATGHVARLSLVVRRGEVVGLAGLVGAGRSEVLECIAGLRPLKSGRIRCDTRPAFLPEDRTTKGLIPTLRLRQNLFLPAPAWLLRHARERTETERWIDVLHIRASGPEAAIASLSGGNQQKLLLARALRHHAGVVLLDEPTAGVDVGAKAEIHDLVRRLAKEGAAILLASSDLPELLLLCDRIVALREGQVTGTLHGEEASEPRLAALITGAQMQSQAES